MMRLTILLRAGAPAFEVVRMLADRLDFRPMRGLDRRLRVLWPVEQVLLTLDDHRSDHPLWAGYDVALTGNFDDELLAFEVFGDLRALGLPMLLRQLERVLVAWSPTAGARTARGDTLAAWDDYVLPPVSTPAGIAPADTLGRLYAQILADPDDDGLRLAYADAVEADHPRYAELIRTQVAYVRDRIAHQAWEPGRASQMFDLARTMHADIPPSDAWDLLTDGYSVVRGFVESVTIRVDTFAGVAERMVAAIPLRMLRLTDASPSSLTELAVVPALEQLRGLSLARNPIGDAGLHGLLTSPYLTRLRWLDLTRTGVSAAGIESLAVAGATPQLQCVLADPELALNPEPAFDWDGSLVYITPTPLADRLGARYDVAWLHRGTRDIRGYPDGGPQFDEV